MDRAEHLIMPVFVSAFGGLAGFSRYMRNNMLEVMRQDYIRTARPKAFRERSGLQTRAPDALMPVITILGLSLPGIIGGSVIMETVFGIPAWASSCTRRYSRGLQSRHGHPGPGCVLTMLGNFLPTSGTRWRIRG